ncbi:unnamed protein product [Brachionus calyciflorus]|uniref:carnitine O-palmitoyltransferase n=1 Tax=Brachionus calyciflorus TaxID=104777 RepID=A0A813QWV6_9BILA|nr:unnamed protein product [Brachionus calyciflorus]
MAEAHQGVAFTFTVTEDEGLHFSVSLEAFKAVVKSGYRSWRKQLARLINQVLNGLYPSHPLRGILIIALLTGLRHYKKIDLSFGAVDQIKLVIPKSLISSEDKAEFASTVLLASAGWLTGVVARRYALQALFSYHGWMYEERGKGTLKTKLWTGLVKILMGNNPKLYSYQSSLPKLPVPNVNDTINRYLRTVRPLLDDENYKRFEKEADDFKKGIGKRLQRYLILKSFIAPNYVSDWWEEYVYLRGRSPIMVNSNFYALDCIFRPPNCNQASRAANCIVAALMHRRNLENENIRPIMVQNTVPLCARQYERQFNTTRIPGEVTDKIVHYNDSKHVAVYCKGKWYKLYAYYHSKPLNAKELEIQLEKILNDESEASKGEMYLGGLTAGDRVPWAQARNSYFSKGINKTSLAAIEKAAFCVILDDETFEITANDTRDLDKFAHSILHGKGHDRWFDKSFNMIVSKNARVGLNVEHTWADAPVTGHMLECIIYHEYFTIGYDENGHSRGQCRYEELPDPVRLKWDFTPKLEEAIMSNYAIADKLLNDVDLHIYVHDSFGKGFSKKCKCSPDAFAQMALQLAYYKDTGRFHLTYEASMTRLFKEGRTETVRSCSIESREWVLSMLDETKTKAERVKLFKKACEFHVQQYRDAMTGKGVDRHLFTLYVVSRYLEVDTPFLKEILSEPWRLSTSQTPSNQTNLLDVDKLPEFKSCGGGFGPVADDGYGVSYVFSGEDTMFFHISSKRSCQTTDSYRFGENIKKTLEAIKDLFD